MGAHLSRASGGSCSRLRFLKWLELRQNSVGVSYSAGAREGGVWVECTHVSSSQMVGVTGRLGSRFDLGRKHVHTLARVKSAWRTRLRGVGQITANEKAGHTLADADLHARNKRKRHCATCSRHTLL